MAQPSHPRISLNIKAVDGRGWQSQRVKKKKIFSDENPHYVESDDDSGDPIAIHIAKPIFRNQDILGSISHPIPVESDDDSEDHSHWDPVFAILLDLADYIEPL